jgi:hypothetical protein
MNVGIEIEIGHKTRAKIWVGRDVNGDFIAYENLPIL